MHAVHHGCQQSGLRVQGHFKHAWVFEIEGDVNRLIFASQTDLQSGPNAAAVDVQMIGHALSRQQISNGG